MAANINVNHNDSYHEAAAEKVHGNLLIFFYGLGLRINTSDPQQQGIHASEKPLPCNNKKIKTLSCR